MKQWMRDTLLLTLITCVQFLYCEYMEIIQDMIKRVCDQQPAIVAVLHHRFDLSHLEISSQECRIVEDIIDLLDHTRMLSLTYLLQNPI